jgi:imidazolonepropionase-like amidohydrolase
MSFASGSVTFASARVVDPRGASISAPTDVHLRDGRIVAIGGTHPDAGSGAVTVHDIGGRFLAPGLVSVHSHLSVRYPFHATDEHEDPGLSVARALPRAQEAIKAGITTIRSVHEQNRADLLIREAAAHGWVQVPRILGAGRAVSRPDGHGKGMGCAYARGAEAFAAAARGELDAGADHVKIFITGGIAEAGEDLASPQMADEEIAATVQAAQAGGTYVVAHAASGTAIKQALRCGVRAFEHAYRLDAATARQMRETEALLTPTLCVTRSPDWMRGHDFTEDQVVRAMETGGDHLESIRTAVKAGITLLNGTDYPPGSADRGVAVAVREMGYAVDAGLSPLEAFRTATINPLRLLRTAGDVGELIPGAWGDAVVLERSPLDDVTAYAAPIAVYQGGAVVTR